jgi:hypothetical protein
MLCHIRTVVVECTDIRRYTRTTPDGKKQCGHILIKEGIRETRFVSAVMLTNIRW